MSHGPSMKTFILITLICFTCYISEVFLEMSVLMGWRTATENSSPQEIKIMMRMEVVTVLVVMELGGTETVLTIHYFLLLLMEAPVNLRRVTTSLGIVHFRGNQHLNL